jgi:hypothetical protein
MAQLGHTLGSPVAFPRDRAVRRRDVRDRIVGLAASLRERHDQRRLLRQLRADTEIARLTGGRV